MNPDPNPITARWRWYHDTCQYRMHLWSNLRLPARIWYLLIAGYCRSLSTDDDNRQIPRYVRNRLGSRGLRMIQFVETKADRGLTPAERDRAHDCTHPRREHLEPDDVPEHFARIVDPAPPGRYGHPEYHENIDEILRAALDDDTPHRALALLGRVPFEGPQIRSWPALYRVIECLRPDAWSWENECPWNPPSDAVLWAEGMYRDRDFGSMPILADLCEDYDNADGFLLDHMRNHPEHFLGCASVERVLGRGSRWGPGNLVIPYRPMPEWLANFRDRLRG